MQDLRKFLPFSPSILPSILTGSSSANDAKFYNLHRKGEIFELRQDLASKSLTRRIEAMKAVIASMTIGKDVSSLFPEVLKCICTSNLELKKLVYLYLMNYAHSQPDLVILAVNSFCMDAQQAADPIVRALAIRTMSGLRVVRVLNHICDPLYHALSDSSPLVRKTAALCIPKVREIAPELVEEFGFVERLRQLLFQDSHPMVISNATAALNEMKALEIGSASLLFQLLSTLNDCTEWGQVALMDVLAAYSPANEEEALHILIHVTPRLNHVNSAVVMAAVRIIVQICDEGESFVANGKNSRMIDEDHAAFYRRRIVSPLLSLLSPLSYPQEIVYCCLRTIKVLICKHKKLFNESIALFFCRYSDPLWIKREKIDALMMLADEENGTKIVSELLEYSRDADLEFALLSVKALGLIGMRNPTLASSICSILIGRWKESQSIQLNNKIIAILALLARNYINQENGEIQSYLSEYLESFLQVKDEFDCLEALKIDPVASEEACEALLLLTTVFVSGGGSGNSESVKKMWKWLWKIVNFSQMTPKCQSLAVALWVSNPASDSRLKKLLWLEERASEANVVPSVAQTIDFHLKCIRSSSFGGREGKSGEDHFLPEIGENQISFLAFANDRSPFGFSDCIGTIEGIEYERLPNEIPSQERNSSSIHSNELPSGQQETRKKIPIGPLIDLDLSLVSPTSQPEFNPGTWGNLMDFDAFSGGAIETTTELESSSSPDSAQSTQEMQCVFQNELFELNLQIHSLEKISLLLTCDVPLCITFKLLGNRFGLQAFSTTSSSNNSSADSIELPCNEEIAIRLLSSTDSSSELNWDQAEEQEDSALNSFAFALEMHLLHEEQTSTNFHSQFTIPIEMLLQPWEKEFSGILMPFSRECSAEQTVISRAKFQQNSNFAAWLPTLDKHVFWSEGKLFSNDAELLSLCAQ